MSRTMSNHVTLLADLDVGLSCSGEAAAAIRDLEAEVERLKGGIEKWLREGVNKYDTCPHGKMWYEGCEACDESYFAALIAPQEQSE